MILTELQILLEIDQGLYHVFQTERLKYQKQTHEKFDFYAKELIENGFIKYLNQELVLTNEGRDILTRTEEFLLEI